MKDQTSDLPPFPINAPWMHAHDKEVLRKWCLDAIEANRKRQYRPVYEEGWKDALEWASKRRGEPVACFKCGHAKHGGECVNVAPQPAEPVKVPSEDERAAQGLPPYGPRKPTEEEWARLTENGRKAWGNHPAVPEKEPPCDT